MQRQLCKTRESLGWLFPPRELLGIGSPNLITEFRSLTTIMVDHVERCHPKTCAVPHYPNITVKLDKCKSVLTSLSLQRGHLSTSFFCPFLKFWMAKETVIVYYDAKVRGDEFSIVSLNKRIALNKFSVIDDRQTIQV